MYLIFRFNEAKKRSWHKKSNHLFKTMTSKEIHHFTKVDELNEHEQNEKIFPLNIINISLNVLLIPLLFTFLTTLITCYLKRE